MAILRGDLAVVGASDLLDSAWYLDRYKDVGMLGLGAAEHYLRIGASLLRDPSPRFSTAFYLERYVDVANAGMNPLVHFLMHGRQEGRLCMPPQRTNAPDHAQPAARVSASEHEARKRAHGTYRTHPGRMPALAAAKTVLVCAHVSGKHLFGGERSLLDILDGFAGAGYNVVVTTPGISNRAYLGALRDRCLAVVEFRYGWWRRGCPVDESNVANFAHVIAKHDIDAVHVNTIMLREPLVAARRMGIPAVVHVRELIAHDVALQELIGETPARIVDEVVANADWIVANSEATAASFAKAGATCLVPNTIDTDVFDIPRREPTGTINIALLSSNLPKKGTLDFVAVANLLQEDLPSARFLLIGPDNAHTQALKDQQARGEISPHILFPGYQEDPAKAMAEVDVLLNLSHFQESFGRTVLEAMAARHPVVVYDWGALPELVVDGHTGYVVPYMDVAAVAEKLKVLCRDPDAIQTMGEAGRQRAVALYGKPHYSERLASAYARIFALAADTPAPKLTLPARMPSIWADGAAPLRIAYFLWHFPVPSETFVLNEIRILVAQGHDVQVFCRQSPYKDFKPDFPVQWTRVTDPADLARKLIESGRTIVHSHFVYPTVTEMVWPACEQAKIPFTFIAHAQDIFRHSNDAKNQIGSIGQSPWCLRVVVPSRFHRDYVEIRGVPADKIFINPNGIDPGLYDEGRDAARVGRSKRSICAIHRFTEKKGLEHLIRAGADLARDGISIHLYGYGDLEETYRRLIEEANLDNVFVHGPVEGRREMLEVFQRHDLFACPSVRAADGDMDGIPTVLMEAMASGLPVLSTGISGIPDLVQDGITGIVCEGDPGSIATAVRRFYALPDSQVAAMIDDAAALIRRDFHAAQLTAALVRLWQRRTIDVLIVSWNNPAQLREVIGRLLRFTTLPYHLIVCDNGSSAEVLAYLCQVHASHDNATIIFNRDNAYVGPGTNICLQHGGSDYAVYVCGKEGFVVDYGWEKGLVQYMETHSDVGLAGTFCHSPSYLTGADYPKGIPLFSRFRNQAFAAENPDRRFVHVQGGFFVIRRAMYDAIGGFSDEVPHNYTDVEYSYYVESEGWSLGSPPRLLALFNKTRPGLFSRIDESVAAMHPPTLEDLPLLDRIVRREAAYCNLCGWDGVVFEQREGLDCCRACGSRPADRSLYRYLAESTLTYRRLPALGIDLGDSIQATWQQQFQGQMLSGAEFRNRIEQHGSLDFKRGALKLVYLGNVLEGEADLALLAEVSRLLAADGVLLIRLDTDDPRQLATVAKACGLRSLEPVRYSSSVVRYDSRPLHVGRRVEVAQCVS
jgi:glycosyltransferase involved in cell wall biosynthesis